MRQIAKNLKVSTGVIYHYFANKDELFLKMLQRLSIQDAILAKDKVSGNELSLESRLDGLFDFLKERGDDFQKMLFLVYDYMGQNDNIAQTKVVEVLDSYVGVAKGRLGEGREILGQLLYYMALGKVVDSQLRGEKADLQNFSGLIKILFKSMK